MMNNRRLSYVYLSLTLLKSKLIIDLCLASSPTVSQNRRFGILASIDPSIKHFGSSSSSLSGSLLRRRKKKKGWSNRIQRDQDILSAQDFSALSASSVNQCSSKRTILNNLVLSHPLRAGGASSPSSGQPFPSFDNINTAFGSVEQLLKVVFETVTTVGMIVLPPTTFVVRNIYKFYNKLPHDAIMAQAGLVYCFAGGYFPTLFAAITAAQNSGMSTIFQAVSDLIDEGSKAIDACINDEIPNTKNGNANAPYWGEEQTSFIPFEELSPHKRFGRKTRIVLATVDPVKINTALGALYVTWLGVSAVLEKEFARTISLSVTIAEYLYPMMSFIVAPPFRLLVPNDLHRWIPLIVGWGCKALAMSVAWKLQRILSAATSAIAGGLMFSRHLLRMIFRRSRMSNKDRLVRSMKLKSTSYSNAYNNDNDDVTVLFDDSTTAFDEVIGIAIAGLGLWIQIGDGFSFKLPFPLNFILLPFTIAENWIQWQITKKAE